MWLQSQVVKDGHKDNDGTISDWFLKDILYPLYSILRPTFRYVVSYETLLFLVS